MVRTKDSALDTAVDPPLRLAAAIRFQLACGCEIVQAVEPRISRVRAAFSGKPDSALSVVRTTVS